MDEGKKRDQIRKFILTCNSLQLLQALINIGVAIFFCTFAEAYLNDYMSRVTSADDFFLKTKKWFHVYRNAIKFVLFISVMCTFTRCARFSNCGGVGLYVSNTLLSVLINMCYTVFATRRSTFYVLSFYLQFMAAVLGIRYYLKTSTFDFDPKVAGVCAGLPLTVMSIIISILNSEYSNELIMPNIILFFWSMSCSYTFLLCLEGKKNYVQRKNYCFGSQIAYVDICVNIYEALKGVFKVEDEVDDHLESRMIAVY